METLLHRFRNREPVFVLSASTNIPVPPSVAAAASEKPASHTFNSQSQNTLRVATNILEQFRRLLCPKKCVATTAKVVLAFSPELRAECYAKD